MTTDTQPAVTIICSGDMDGYNPLPLPMPLEMVRRITCTCCKRRRMIAYWNSEEGAQCAECYNGDCWYGTCRPDGVEP